MKKFSKEERDEFSKLYSIRESGKPETGLFDSVFDELEAKLSKPKTVYAPLTNELHKLLWIDSEAIKILMPEIDKAVREAVKKLMPEKRHDESQWDNGYSTGIDDSEEALLGEGA